MTTGTGGNIPNPFLNLNLWQNYLAYWIEVSRNFYENAIRMNEQWLKAIWEPWLTKTKSKDRIAQRGGFSQLNCTPEHPTIG